MTKITAFISENSTDISAVSAKLYFASYLAWSRAAFKLPDNSTLWKFIEDDCLQLFESLAGDIIPPNKRHETTLTTMVPGMPIALPNVNQVFRMEGHIFKLMRMDRLGQIIKAITGIVQMHNQGIRSIEDGA